MQFNINITNRIKETDFRDRNKKARVHVDFPNENMIENLMYRTSRPHAEIKPLVRMVLQEAGLDTEGMFWSQRAGCSCPCSPGFILPNERTGEMIWVKLEGVPSTTGGPELEARAAALGTPVTV